MFQNLPNVVDAEGKGKEKMKEESQQDAQQSALQLQRDYLQAYLDFFSEKPSMARDIALKCADYPIASWNKRYELSSSLSLSSSPLPSQLLNFSHYTFIIGSRKFCNNSRRWREAK